MIMKRKVSYTSLFLYGAQLERVSKFKFLGVTVDDKLSWTDHVVSTCGRAKRLLGYIHRQFHHCGKPTILRLYRSLVLPLLDYCCYVWDLHLIKNVNLLESEQVFACKITRSWSKSNINLRSECNLPPLAVH